MKRIAVLVSTYNGESYIADQLNSILNQNIDTGLYDLQITVRDDGSTDHTVSIIEKLKETNMNISLIPFTKNLGFAKSFMSLLSKVEADYYFFSDQDDIWEQNKVNDFLSIISAEEVKTPICGVFSDAWIADKHANSIGVRLLGQRKENIKNGYLTFMQQIFETYVAGASLCINWNARQQVLEFNFDDFLGRKAHDHFIALIISCYGKLYFLDKPTLRYRQTGNNVYGARNIKKKSILQRLTSLHSRVKDVQRTLYIGGNIMKQVPEKEKLAETMITISNGQASFYERLKFFKNHQRLVSAKYPVTLSLLYTMMTSKNAN